jgi:hypothetical protein
MGAHVHELATRDVAVRGRAQRWKRLILQTALNHVCFPQSIEFVRDSDLLVGGWGGGKTAGGRFLLAVQPLLPSTAEHPPQLDLTGRGDAHGSVSM